MSDTRQIQIKGDAAHAFMKTSKTRKRREQHGGYDVPSPAGAMPFTSENLGRVRNLVSKMVGGSAPALAPPPAPALAPPPAPAILPKQTGGKPKLILEPKKKSMKKLHLAPASVSGGHTHKRSISKTRKIRVNLYGMKKRLTRAKEIHKDSRHKDIEHIKKTLIDAKLIKPRDQSKPESTEYDMMLRKTYENYMLLRNRAL